MTAAADPTITLTLTAEAIPFRDGEIRLALVPFPRKQRDGSYKIAGAETTAYIVFPDNSADLFNTIFDLNVELPWPGGCPITVSEREEIDDAAWDIFRKYGLIVGEFLCDPWGESGDATTQPASLEVDAPIGDAIDLCETESEPHAQFNELDSDISHTRALNLPLLAGSVASHPDKRNTHGTRRK